jgi:hypothetical protein
MKASPSTAIAVPCMWRGGSCHDIISYIDVDDPEPAQTCRPAATWFGHACAASAADQIL